MTLEQARHEVLTLGSSGIERKVAEGWFYRAVACYQLAVERRCLRWFHEASGYSGEAIEHAAATGDDAFLAEVRTSLEAAKDAAMVGLGA